MSGQHPADHLDAATRLAGHAEEQLAAGDIQAATALAAIATAHAQIAAAAAVLERPPP